MRKQPNLKNRHKIWTLPKKIHRWQLSTWKDDQHRMSLGKYKLKQQEYSYTPIRMVKVQNTVNTKRWWGCRITGILDHCWWKWKMLQPLWKAVWQFLTGLNIFLPHDVAIVSFGINSNKLKIYVHTKPAQFYSNCQNLEATKRSFNRWMENKTVVHPYNGCI